jgi:hypothetical protein
MSERISYKDMKYTTAKSTGQERTKAPSIADMLTVIGTCALGLAYAHPDYLVPLRFYLFLPRTRGSGLLYLATATYYALIYLMPLIFLTQFCVRGWRRSPLTRTELCGLIPGGIYIFLIIAFQFNVQATLGVLLYTLTTFGLLGAAIIVIPMEINKIVRSRARDLAWTDILGLLSFFLEGPISAAL